MSTSSNAKPLGKPTPPHDPAQRDTRATRAENAGVYCFTHGTLIATARGAVQVQDLTPGDLVQTMDRGFQPLRWIGQRKLDARDLSENAALRPIRISKGATGLKHLTQDLVVSAQHRLLLASGVAQRMIGQSEVLVAAQHLLSVDGVAIAEDIDSVTYVHILFDEHEIVFANGVPSETLYLGTHVAHALTPEGRAEVQFLFPELASPDFAPQSCRPIIEGKKACRMAERHFKNKKPLLDLRVRKDPHKVLERLAN